MADAEAAEPVSAPVQSIEVEPTETADTPVVDTTTAPPGADSKAEPAADGSSDIDADGEEDAPGEEDDEQPVTGGAGGGVSREQYKALKNIADILTNYKIKVKDE
jgi:hypothetical protein